MHKNTQLPYINNYVYKPFLRHALGVVLFFALAEKIKRTLFTHTAKVVKLHHKLVGIIEDNRNGALKCFFHYPKFLTVQVKCNVYHISTSLE